MDLFSFLKKRQPTQKDYSNQRRSVIVHTGSITPSFVSLSKNADLLHAYHNTPPLSSIINYEARVFTKMKFKHFKKTGKGLTLIENSPLVEKLNNPNPLQTGLEFFEQNYIYWQLFGNSQMLNYSTSFTSKTDYNKTQSLWNLPTQHISYQLSDNYFSAKKISDIIIDVLWEGQRQSEIKVDDLILLNDPNICFANGQYSIGKSRASNLEQSISNIQGLLTSKNVLINNRGAINVFVGETRGDQIPLPSDTEEIRRVSREFQDKYGLSYDQTHTIFTSANLKLINTIPPIKDLMLTEMWQEEVIEIANAYQFPIPLLNNLENASGRANMDIFQKSLYENKIIPDWEKLEQALNNYFQLESKKEILKVSYEHVEVLQGDRKKFFEIAKVKTDILSMVQKAYYEGNMSEDGAINQVSLVMGITKEEAKELLSLKPKEIKIETNA